VGIPRSSEDAPLALRIRGDDASEMRMSEVSRRSAQVEVLLVSHVGTWVRGFVDASSVERGVGEPGEHERFLAPVGGLCLRGGGHLYRGPVTLRRDTSIHASPDGWCRPARASI
jgi:hypothetical protein